MPDQQPTDDPRVQTLLELLEHDRKHVMLYVAVCFGVPSFLLSKLGSPPPSLWVRGFLLLTVASFIAAGVYFFRYAQQLHWQRLPAIEDIMTWDTTKLRQTLFGSVWSTAGVLYERGERLLKAGSLFLVVYFALWLFVPLAPKGTPGDQYGARFSGNGDLPNHVLQRQAGSSGDSAVGAPVLGATSR